MGPSVLETYYLTDICEKKTWDYYLWLLHTELIVETEKETRQSLMLINICLFFSVLIFEFFSFNFLKGKRTASLIAYVWVHKMVCTDSGRLNVKRGNEQRKNDNHIWCSAEGQSWNDYQLFKIWLNSTGKKIIWYPLTYFNNSNGNIYATFSQIPRLYTNFLFLIMFGTCCVTRLIFSLE